MSTSNGSSTQSTIGLLASIVISSPKKCKSDEDDGEFSDDQPRESNTINSSSDNTDGGNTTNENNTSNENISARAEDIASIIAQLDPNNNNNNNSDDQNNNNKNNNNNNNNKPTANTVSDNNNDTSSIPPQTERISLLRSGPDWKKKSFDSFVITNADILKQRRLQHSL